MYSLDQVVASPPISAVLSLLLIVACDSIGVALLRVFGISSLNVHQWQRWQAPVVGAMALGVVLYPLALAGLTPRLFMQSVAFSCVVLGLLHTVRAVCGFVSMRQGSSYLISAIPSQLHGWNSLILLLSVGMGLVALGPVTNADSLDYHIGVPIALLNEGGMPFAPEWFHSRLAGNGEVLNALGLAVGAEQFGSLLQFAGLMGIVGLLLCAESNYGHQGETTATKLRPMIALAALSAPVLLLLVSSSKPQLLPIAMTTMALALVFYPSRRQLPPRHALLGFTLVCLLVMSASQAKLIYMLGGGAVGLLSLAIMARQRLLLPALGIGFLMALLVLVPPVVWKYYYFHAGFIDALIKPLPGYWPGTDAFEAFLRGYRDSDVPFPLSLILPSGTSTISTVIGAGLILLVALRPGRDRWLLAGIATAVFVGFAVAVLGQFSSRSYLEPYFWLLMVLAIQPASTLSRGYLWFRWPIFGQALVTIPLCWYGVVAFLPGSITPEWRSTVMERAANGYSVMKWVDSVLPAGAVLLNGHRSMALAPRDAVSFGWSEFVEVGSPASEPYLRRLKDRGVTHMLVIGEPHNAGKLSGCIGAVIAGPSYGRVATRNPFNAGERYEAWIVEFESERLPECTGKPAGKE